MLVVQDTAEMLGRWFLAALSSGAGALRPHMQERREVDLWSVALCFNAHPGS